MTAGPLTIGLPAGGLMSEQIARHLSGLGHSVLRMPRDGDLPPEFGGAQVLVTMPDQPIGPDLLRRMPALRLVLSAVIGVDHIDIPSATENCILVANCPAHENIVGVAEAAVAMMATLLLQLRRKEASLRAGKWRPEHSAHILYGKTVGLIGYGRIGRAVEERLQGWDAKVQAYDPYVPGTIPLEQLLRESDVVSLHVIMTPETRHMIGAAQLSLMKPAAVIVNTSRGGAVDEAALAAAIDGGRLAGAAIDVFETEPVHSTNPLLRCDPERVILTPHAAGHNQETNPATVRLVAAAVEAVGRGEPPENLVNPGILEAWRRR